MDSQSPDLRQKFRREYPVPPFTADFCCVELKLVLEIDGADHLTAEGQQRDRVRDEVFAQQGFFVARIPGYDILREPERVLSRIEECVRQRMQELGRIERGNPNRCNPSPQPLSPEYRGEGSPMLISRRLRPFA